MTDINLRQDEQVPVSMQTCYKDMGDGTHAQVLATVEAGTSVTVKRAVIHCNTNGNNTVIAAVAGKQLKIVGVLLVVAGDVDVRFESGAGGTALTGIMSLAADGNGFVLPQTTPGFHWLETTVGALLNLELSAGVWADGCIVYYEE